MIETKSEEKSISDFINQIELQVFRSREVKFSIFEVALVEEGKRRKAGKAGNDRQIGEEIGVSLLHFLPFTREIVLQITTPGQDFNRLSNSGKIKLHLRNCGNSNWSWIT